MEVTAIQNQPATGFMHFWINIFRPKGLLWKLGGVDGVIESNTYYLERFRVWTGILIEPVPETFERIRYYRYGCDAVQYALVGHDYEEQFVLIDPQNAMSPVVRENKEGGKLVSVSARTLEDVFQDRKVSRIDFLSLDVKGF